MPRLIHSTPKYRLHRASGQAVVTLSGHDYYIGAWKSRASRVEYDRLVSEWLAAGRVPFAGSSRTLSIAELCLAYWKFARGYYQRNGQPSAYLTTVRIALRILRQPYSRTPADEFGPLKLRALQQQLVDSGKSRKYINQLIGIVGRVFKWGASMELVPPHVHQALSTVPGLRRGRTKARETPPVRPIDDLTVDRTLPYLPQVVADMVRIQRLTGGRPQDVCGLRPCDLDRSDEIWTYRPLAHKNEYRGHERVLAIGPRAQVVLLPYLDRASDEHCFVPAESEHNRNAERRLTRRSPMTPSQAKRQRKISPCRGPGARYSTESYRRAIARACDAAGVEAWSPNRLRHTAGTIIRREYGLEAAQVVLGHANAAVSQIYAERDLALASKIMRELG